MADLGNSQPVADMKDVAPAATAKEIEAQRHDAISSVIDDLIPADDENDEADLHVASGKTRAEKEEPEVEEEEDEDADELEELPGEDDDLEDAADDGAKASDESDDDTEDDEDMALHRAYTVLHDANVPASVLKNTPKKKLIAWAAEVVERAKGATDGASKSQRASDTSTDAKGTGEPAQASTAAAWADRRRVIAEKLGIDEEAADAFQPLHDENEAMRAEVKALRSELEQTNAATRERAGQATINAEMKRLQEHGYTQLGRSEKAREKLKDAAITIVEGLKARGLPIDATKVFNRAAREAFGDPKRDDLAQLRRNGTSTPSRLGGGLGGAAPSEESYWTKAIDLAVDGKSEQIKRLRPPPLREARR